jgi:glycerophosphoryl diester phosphodiesterase
MKIIAHRGGASHAPENTLAAFKLALSRPIVDAMECDVHLTKDNKLIVTHDYEIDRTSNGSGKISDMTCDILKDYDCGCWFSETFAGERYPLLEELLEVVDGQKPLVIELKREGAFYPEMAKVLLQTLASYPYKEQLYIKSFDHELIEEISHITASYKLGLLFYNRPILLLEQLKACNATFVSFYAPALSPKILMDCRNAGIEIMVWTVDDEEDMKTLWALDDTISIVTNDLSAAERALGKDK